MRRMATILFIIGILCIATAIFLRIQNRKNPSEVDLPLENQEKETKLSSKEKGDMFEDYVIQYFANNSNIRFIGKVSDYFKNGVVAEENQEPDLRFAMEDKKFSVECKWRAHYNTDGAIKWSYPKQIKRYEAYQKSKQTPVYIALGIGGTPDNPKEFYLVPLYVLPQDFAARYYIKKYQVKKVEDLVLIIQGSHEYIMTRPVK